MLLCLLVGVLALCCGLGIGSAGILVTYLTLCLGIPQSTAQGYNLIFFIFASVSAFFIHRKRRNLPTVPILLMILCGFAGVYPGMLALKILPESVLRKIFGGVLTISGIAGLFRYAKDAARRVTEAQKKRRNS